MCLAVVYVNSGGGKKEAMQDVIRIEAENRGYRLVNLLGEEKFIEGQLKVVDFFKEHFVLIEAVSATHFPRGRNGRHQSFFQS